MDVYLQLLGLDLHVQVDYVALGEGSRKPRSVGELLLQINVLLAKVLLQLGLAGLKLLDYAILLELKAIFVRQVYLRFEAHDMRLVLTV